MSKMFFFSILVPLSIILVVSSFYLERKGYKEKMIYKVVNIGTSFMGAFTGVMIGEVFGLSRIQK